MSLIATELNAWTVEQVMEWARETAKLSPSTLDILLENEIDGSTLLTLSKAELKEELGVTKLSARRYLWDAIQRLKHQHMMGDTAVALAYHQEEINALAGGRTEVSTATPPEDDRHRQNVDSTVLATLNQDLASQRQILQDHDLALRLHGQSLRSTFQGYGQQFVEDLQFALEQQRQFEEEEIQCRADRELAMSLASRRERNEASAAARNARSTTGSPSMTLFGRCIDVCVKNKINVAEALQSGQHRALLRSDYPTIVSFDDDSSGSAGVEEHKEDPDDEENASEELFIPTCSICYDESVRGYDLSCEHQVCRSCLRKLFRSALGDTSLLPIRCCDLPIDMNIGTTLLDEADMQKLIHRSTELSCKKKMYCPSCNGFINLDLVDSSTNTHLDCPYCSVALCSVCMSEGHAGLTCEQYQKIQERKRFQDDAGLQQLAKEKGWKACPGCHILIELRSGCNHMVCAGCQHEFCFQCLREWNTRSGTCASGTCEVWQEENLIEDAEARVRVQEEAQGHQFNPVQRRERTERAMTALLGNETCHHEWRRRSGYHGNCERCGYSLNYYAMVCNSHCASTVCYTCAHHRLPTYGWR